MAAELHFSTDRHLTLCGSFLSLKRCFCACVHYTVFYTQNAFVQRYKIEQVLNPVFTFAITAGYIWIHILYNWRAIP